MMGWFHICIQESKRMKYRYNTLLPVSTHPNQQKLGWKYSELEWSPADEDHYTKKMKEVMEIK